MANFYAQYPASSGGTFTDPSIGVNGTLAPTSSTQVAGQNPGGNLQPLQTDSSGNLKVAIAAEPLSPLATKDAADGTPGSAVPGTAIQIAGSDGTNLRTIATDATGKPNINNISGTISLPTGASTSANQTNGSQQTQIVQGGNTATVTASSALKVDGSAVTQPVSAVSLPLPTGAATSANQTNGSQETQIVQGGNTATVTASNALKVDGSAVTQPVSGTVTSNQGTAAALAGAWPVEVTDGTNILGTSSHPLRIDPTGTTSQPVTQSTASNLLAQVSQPTAASLNATVVQGTASNLLAQVSQPTAASLNATVVQGTAANLNATISIAAAQTLATVTTVSAVTAITNALPAGTNLLGKTGIDQTTNGSTNAVAIIPNSTSTGSNSSVFSTALEASHVIKASAGRLYQLTGVNTKASAQYIQVFNSTTVPTDGTVPILLAYVPSGSVFSWDFGSIGRYFGTGIAVSNSSTAATKTIGSADCWFNAEYS